MSAQAIQLKEKFKEGLEKANQEFEKVQSKAENSLDKSRAWLDDTMEIPNEVLAEFIAKVTDRKEEIEADFEEIKEEHKFNLPLADYEII